MDVLLWSYQLMDVHLQRCFILFAIFPKGSRYFQSAMVQYWVALDFIQLASDDVRTVEDVGFEYFQLMVANSIIQLVNGMYVMHNLYHDLAQKLSTEDCCCITDYSEKKKPPTTVLYLFLRITNEHWKEELSSISHLSNLHTLILDIQYYFIDVSEIFTMICKCFKSLRVLNIRWKGMKTLPRVVGDLRNLRYLNVSDSSIEVLPDTVSQLYHLQFLLLPNSVKNVPAKLSNLIKLRSITTVQRNGKSDHALPPVPYLGRLTSLQFLPEFHVRKEEGYELQQLEHLREIGGLLRIAGLENVGDKNEAIAGRLIDKPKLTRVKLVWTGSVKSVASEVDVIEALQPPTNLKLLTIDGYKGSVYPTWLREGLTLPYLKYVELYNCNALKVLPSNLSQFRYCRELFLENLGALRELSAFPDNLVKLVIFQCPCLFLSRENELQPETDELLGTVGCGFLPLAEYPWKEVLNFEVKSFEQTVSVEKYSEQLQIIKSAIKRDNIAPEQWEVVVGRAWWCCHQQRMNFIFSGITRANKLKLPVRLCTLNLGYCCISDEALSDGLRGRASLKQMHLEGIMTITTLPPADVLKTLQRLQDLEIVHCWCLRSLGGLHALPHLQKFHVEGCWRLEMKNDDCALLHPTLQSVIIRDSIISNNILRRNFPCLQEILIFDCQVPDSLSLQHLNSLQKLILFNCTSLRLIKLCPIIGTLMLVELPNLDVQSILDSWRGCRQLNISSSLMLEKLLMSENFVAPLTIVIEKCQEEVISFVKFDHLQSIKKLAFAECKTKNLRTSLSDFSALSYISFKDSPKISELPELPSSVKGIKIKNCPVLRERCQPNGPDWHKIQGIKTKLIE